jgi:hypothetical protein
MNILFTERKSNNDPYKKKTSLIPDVLLHELDRIIEESLDSKNSDGILDSSSSNSNTNSDSDSSSQDSQEDDNDEEDDDDESSSEADDDDDSSSCSSSIASSQQQHHQDQLSVIEEESEEEEEEDSSSSSSSDSDSDATITEENTRVLSPEIDICPGWESLAHADAGGTGISTEVEIQLQPQPASAERENSNSDQEEGVGVVEAKLQEESGAPTILFTLHPSPPNPPNQKKTKKSVQFADDFKNRDDDDDDKEQNQDVVVSGSEIKGDTRIVEAAAVGGGVGAIGESGPLGTGTLASTQDIGSQYFVIKFLAQQQQRELDLIDLSELWKERSIISNHNQVKGHQEEGKELSRFIEANTATSYFTNCGESDNNNQFLEEGRKEEEGGGESLVSTTSIDNGGKLKNTFMVGFYAKVLGGRESS